MIEISPDPYDEFMALPVGAQGSDPRFDVRRIPESEFERVYECVDAAFATTRPRAVYEWMYRRNPYGRAQVWAVEERSSGRILKSGTSFPWPIWRGMEPIRGALSGDAATVPDWQRRGLSRIRREVKRTHPWQGKVCAISGPNAGSRIVSKKNGEDDEILGRLRGGVIALQALPGLEEPRFPSILAAVPHAAASGLTKVWQSIAMRTAASGDRHFGELRRFSPDFDAVTLQTMSFPGYWCPHSWQLLNWRYLEHPTESYAAFALTENDAPIGYSVLRFAGSRATVAEFAVSAPAGGNAIALMAGSLDAARQAGCSYLTFFGTPGWRHWTTFRRGGMVPCRTNNFFEVEYDADPQGSRDFLNWQVMPGDRDYH